ncbi:hypothetical protein AVEN_136651-1 [Araneus ventricosus]|uniref:Uncharacterized protein n=1 Tax=Araneus ventricosus TaxID=182803 RepID=A0A4Y2CAQ7_ARAVE|nr:hypothetical protein AVEN_136651-1 [Araneus ventricosus]
MNPANESDPQELFPESTQEDFQRAFPPWRSKRALKSGPIIQIMEERNNKRGGGQQKVPEDERTDIRKAPAGAAPRTPDS